MAKLTRKQRAHLESVLRDLKRGHEYLMREDVAVARRESRPSTSLAYVRADLSESAAEALRVPAKGDALSPVAKDCGSHLVGIGAALSSLEAFLAHA